MYQSLSQNEENPVRHHALTVGDSAAGSKHAAPAADVNGAESDDEIVVRVKKYRWRPPAGSEHRPYRQHQGEGSQYLRDVSRISASQRLTDAPACMSHSASIVG